MLVIIDREVYGKATSVKVARIREESFAPFVNLPFPP